MTFQEWQSQLPGQLFAVIDAAMDTTAVADYCNQGGVNAIPLFAGTAFADHAEQGPWLLPSPSPAFIATHLSHSGFYVISDAPVEGVVLHWQSLMEVAFEGDVMWLRFADNRIFPTMLAAMSQQTLDDVLGPCAGLWANNTAWLRTPDAAFTPRQAPWFRVQPHHLAPLYDERRHANLLSRRFWQQMRAVMARHPHPEAALASVLNQANQAGLEDDVLDGVVAGALTLQAGMTLDAIRAPLMLTDDEMAQVNNWLNKHPELTGAV